MRPHTEPLEHDVTVVDTGFVRPRFDAAYLVEDGGRAAFVDTGHNAAVPRLLAALEAVGIAREAVDYVIVTHVHLDHAGGAGLLLSQLPNAKLVVHPRGARHLVDPAQLMAGVRAVYGEEIAARDYGELVPVPAGRVIETHDGMVLTLGERPLVFFDTPGHARHHHCIWDAQSRGFFTGDTFGLAYPDLPTPEGAFAFPTTTPVQFEPEALRASIARLLDHGPARLYLTHYGEVRNIAAHAESVLRQLDRMVELALEAGDGEGRHGRLVESLLALYLEEYARQGGTESEASLRAQLAGDAELNAQGLEVWLDKRAKHA